MEIAGVKQKRGRTAKQLELAQFFTPTPIAKYMASMFDEPKDGPVRILDPGAGEGVLGMTLAQRFKESHSVDAEFVELDHETADILSDNLKRSYAGDSSIQYRVTEADFIDQGIDWYGCIERFSHIIINPPYFKLRTNSHESIRLRMNDIVVTNIYAAFIWLSVKLLEPGGELVAIVPRSFCNGPYFLKFRQHILSTCSLEKIHIFKARDKAFSDDGVLQENVIIHLKAAKQSPAIRLSFSNDRAFSDLETVVVPAEQVIAPQDPHKVIHIPTGDAEPAANGLFEHTLQEVGIAVSTGPVVDFRLKDYISFDIGSDAKGVIPLIYPAHMDGTAIGWPTSRLTKKGQYFAVTDETLRWTVPLDGHHVIVRRFSSKEERRRIFAAVIDPQYIKSDRIAYENHVNFFHINKSGLDKDLAYGLCAFLNSKVVDDFFRSFSGHTQVNVSDLKRLRYPRVEVLRQIGAEIQKMPKHDDQVINDVVGSFKS